MSETERKGALSYRQLTVWQKSMDLAQEVYQLVPILPKEETYGMRSQITRAAVSVPANIADGWSREWQAEKARFLAIAQGSLAETVTLLTLCERIGWFPAEAGLPAQQLAEEISRLLTVMRRKLRSR